MFALSTPTPTHTISVKSVLVDVFYGLWVNIRKIVWFVNLILVFCTRLCAYFPTFVKFLVIFVLTFLFFVLSFQHTACLQVGSGVSAIFGPSDSLLGSHIQSVCDALDIPHLEARLELEQQEREVSINLYPPPSLIGDALRDLIRYLNWTRVAVIYEDDMCK